MGFTMLKWSNLQRILNEIDDEDDEIEFTESEFMQSRDFKYHSKKINKQLVKRRL